jgi:hypothetical protein
MASRKLSDTIFELVWKAAHNNPGYGMKELNLIQSMHPTLDMNTLKKVMGHAKRTPKNVEWNIIKARSTN